MGNWLGRGWACGDALFPVQVYLLGLLANWLVLAELPGGFAYYDVAHLCVLEAGVGVRGKGVVGCQLEVELLAYGRWLRSRDEGR